MHLACHRRTFIWFLGWPDWTLLKLEAEKETMMEMSWLLERSRPFPQNGSVYVCVCVAGSLPTLRYARLTMKPLSKIKKHFSSRLPFVLALAPALVFVLPLLLCLVVGCWVFGVGCALCVCRFVAS